MITVTGLEGTSEHEAALTIGSALAKLWPGCETSAADEELVRIAANAKISGYKVSDIDILIAARLRPGRAFAPRRTVRDRSGVRVAGPVQVATFIAVVEVKDHDPSRVKIIGDSIDVRYTSGTSSKWSSAVQQNVEQVHAIKAYFEHQHISLFVHRAVIMRGFDKVPCSGALGRNFDGTSFLTALAETSPVAQSGKQLVVRSATSETLDRALAAPVFRTIIPTSLDRKRMDRIVTRNSEINRYLSMLGTKMLRFRGRGGTGKTVMLLQLAWRAFDERAARSLVLTYNHALTADIRRLMALLNVPSSPDDGGIAVRTVMSFVAGWLGRLGLVDGSDGGLEATYEKQCNEALEMIRRGAVGSSDIEQVKLDDPVGFAFDYIVVDEAQDWPSAELELIKALYGPERLCLADGIDQLVRGGASNWEIGVPESRRMTIPLKRCLRMKANLAVFANALSEHVGINWKVEPNPEAGGGRIILLTGSLEHRKSLIETLLQEARRAGNEAIDFLFCVPPSSVSRDSDGTRSSQTAAILEAWNYDVWDGTNERRRRDFPRSSDVFRIVQYASCRGLEGWTVLLEGLDEFWLAARNDLPMLDRGASDEQDFLIERSNGAWRQCLIPLSRAIDTLVIGINDPRSQPSRALLDVAQSLPDIVEVIEAPSKLHG